MLKHTLEIVRTALKADPEITPETRNEFLAFLRNGGPQAKPVGSQAKPCIVRRKEAAQRLGRSLRAIDLLCQQGLLKKVSPKGRKFALGITSESLDAFISAQ